MYIELLEFDREYYLFEITERWLDYYVEHLPPIAKELIKSDYEKAFCYVTKYIIKRIDKDMVLRAILTDKDEDYFKHNLVHESGFPLDCNDLIQKMTELTHDETIVVKGSALMEFETIHFNSNHSKEAIENLRGLKKAIFVSNMESSSLRSSETLNSWVGDRSQEQRKSFFIPDEEIRNYDQPSLAYFSDNDVEPDSHLSDEITLMNIFDRWEHISNQSFDWCMDKVWELSHKFKIELYDSWEDIIIRFSSHEYSHARYESLDFKKVTMLKIDMIRAEIHMGWRRPLIVNDEPKQTAKKKLDIEKNDNNVCPVAGENEPVWDTLRGSDMIILLALLSKQYWKHSQKMAVSADALLRDVSKDNGKISVRGYVDVSYDVRKKELVIDRAEKEHTSVERSYKTLLKKVEKQRITN